MESAAPLIPQPQSGLLNNSRFHNVNGGNFYNTVGDAHIYNSTNSSANQLVQLVHLHSFVAASALHDSNERFPQPKCHPSTREKILQRILSWAEKDSTERILWLSGSAGMGNSAIAQTVAELCKQKGCLAAAFFFFRSSPERNTSASLIATLAYQITLSVPGAKEFITKAIEDDPALFSKDINSQLFHLIVRPVTLAAREWTSTYKFLIIIDGLDECTDEKQQTHILSAIGNALTTRELPLHFLIASRAEYHIRTRFERNDLQSATAHFVLDVDDTARQDIEIYLEKEFSRIHKEHRIPELPWPPKYVIQSLARRASGQFIYVSTIVKFLDNRRFQPQKRLDLVLRTLPQGTFAEIDLLYTQILNTVSNVEATLLCLGMILFIDQNHFMFHGCSTNLEYLDRLFQLNPGGVEHLLMDLHSVLIVGSGVSIRHKSFSDFLTDKARSGKYFIDKEIIQGKFSGLLWATIPRWLNQIEDVDSADLQAPNHKLWLHDDPLHTAINGWKKLLPDGRHAGEVLGELSAIADITEKKPFDIRSALGKLSNNKWNDLYPVIIFWLSKEKLDKQNPVLWNKYLSLYDRTILRFLKRFEFLDPIHSIHFFFFKNLDSPTLKDEFLCLGTHYYSEIFDSFFSDPRQSGKYYLTPEDRADIVVWMVQYYPRRSMASEVFLRRVCLGDGRAEKNLESLAQLQRPFDTGSFFDNILIDFHLCHASPCAEILIDLIRSHNPDTFPSWLGCKVNEAMARYLLDNSQIYEQSIKIEEDKGIQPPLSHKWGMVPLLPVVGYLLILAFYFKLQWIFFPPAPSHCHCFCSN